MREPVEEPEAVKRVHDIEDLVGDPISFRGIVYALLNEAGGTLLFSKAIEDLGIFYEASPSTGLPALIARERTERGAREGVYRVQVKKL
ncbi:MAG: hypothetical protein QW390_01230 [Candidatus Bathyarchaeia archaeon]